MKRLYSFLTFTILFSSHLFSQQLNNTQWQVRDNASGSIIDYFQFLADTMYASVNNINYSAISTYTEVGNNLKVVDLPSVLGICGTDTGSYSFNIITNTLDLTLLSDSCTDRANYLINPSYTWTKILTTSLEDKSTLSIKIPTYPNPTHGTIHLPIVEALKEVSFSIIDQLGKVVYEGTFKNEQQTLNLNHLQQGVYYLRAADKFNSTQRIVKL